MKTWRLSKDGELLGEYTSESEAIEHREALCGINQRDDYLIVSFEQIANNVHSDKFESKLDKYFKSGTKEKDHATRRSSVKIEGKWT